MEYYGTLGPTCCEPTILKKMFDAGMTGIRLNLSHSSLEGSHAWIYHYFEAAKQTNGEKKLMIDLIGPELRIGYLEGDMGLSTCGYRAWWNFSTRRNHAAYQKRSGNFIR